MENHLYKHTENPKFEVQWQEEKLYVLLISWQEGFCKARYYWILADNQELAESFLTAVCDWNAQIRDEVLAMRLSLLCNQSNSSPDRWLFVCLSSKNCFYHL